MAVGAACGCPAARCTRSGGHVSSLKNASIWPSAPLARDQPRRSLPRRSPAGTPGLPRPRWHHRCRQPRARRSQRLACRPARRLDQAARRSSTCSNYICSLTLPWGELACSQAVHGQVRHIGSLTLDVKSAVWITCGSLWRSPTGKKSSMHSLSGTFSEADATLNGDPQPFPQSCQQAAHSACGVSAQPVHSPVHTMVRRLARHAEDCRNRSIEQTLGRVTAVARLAAVAAR
jgi:hypothetical protein